MEGKKTETKAGRKPFNIIDVLILIILVVCAAGLVIRFGSFSSASSAEKLEDYDIYFSVSNIAYTSEEAFVQGDTITLSNNGIVLGEFAGLETILPAEFFAHDQSGNPIAVNYPEATRIDVTGRIISRGVMSENGYLVGGTTYVAPGAEYAVQSEHMDFVLRITNIVEK